LTIGKKYLNVNLIQESAVIFFFSLIYGSSYIYKSFIINRPEIVVKIALKNTETITAKLNHITINGDYIVKDLQKNQDILISNSEISIVYYN
jgi:hypothetical protein